MTQPFEPIRATDEEIRNALAKANFPALMNAIVHLTHDLSLIEGDIRPQQALLGDPQGTLSDEQKTYVLDLAFKAVTEWRDNPSALFEPDEKQVLQMANFITGTDLADEYAEFALAELAIDESETFPTEDFTVIEDSRKSNFKVLIVGAGMSGLLASYTMSRSGDTFRRH